MRPPRAAQLRRDGAGQAVRAEVKAREPLEVAKGWRDFSGQRVAVETEVPQTGEITHLGGECALQVVDGELQDLKSRQAGDARRNGPRRGPPETMRIPVTRAGVPPTVMPSHCSMGWSASQSRLPPPASVSRMEREDVAVPSGGEHDPGHVRSPSRWYRFLARTLWRPGKSPDKYQPKTSASMTSNARPRKPLAPRRRLPGAGLVAPPQSEPATREGGHRATIGQASSGALSMLATKRQGCPAIAHRGYAPGASQ